MREFTDITILLDRSGSMESIKEAMESSYKEFLTKHRENPSTRMTLIQFDGENPQQVVYQAVPVAEAGRLKLVPRGNTPLLDALCTAIDNTGERLADMDESERPDQVLFIIITDGQENASRKFKRSDVKNRIKKQSNHFKWNFVYLGANQDAFAEAASFGISRDHTLSYHGVPMAATNAWAGLMVNTSTYTKSAGRARGQSSSQALNFNEEQRKKAVDNSEESK